MKLFLIATLILKSSANVCESTLSWNYWTDNAGYSPLEAIALSYS